MSDWYYLDEQNQVCGPVDSLSDARIRFGWSEESREGLDPYQPHGVRPCGWERVAYTEVAEGLTVSTVFLGLDHGFGHGLKVFETWASWGDEHEWDMDRYATWAQAEEGHKQMVHRMMVEVRARRAAMVNDAERT